METLESRTLLCGVAATGGSVISTSGGERSAAVETANAVKSAATKTTLAVGAGTLGQPVIFTVTVRAAAAAGAPAGTVNIIDRRNVLRTLTLSPTTSTDAKYAFSNATFSLTQTPGGSAYFFGRHAVSAAYVPSGAFAASRGNGAFTVPKPTYTALANGVQIDNIVPGAGPAIASGQTADVLYTGYLARNGHIFDDSVNDGNTPFHFTLGAGMAIPGFDAGTVGMKVGETRIVLIPPAQGYGSHANGPIPGNSTLIFVITLELIT